MFSKRLLIFSVFFVPVILISGAHLFGYQDLLSGQPEVNEENYEQPTGCPYKPDQEHWTVTFYKQLFGDYTKLNRSKKNQIVKRDPITNEITYSDETVEVH